MFVPNDRKQAIYAALRKEIGRIFRELRRQGDLELVAGYAMRDHIHVLLIIPPKFSVAHTVVIIVCPILGLTGLMPEASR